MSEAHEAVFILSGDEGWKLTGAYRNGSPESILAVDVGNPAEYAAIPEHLRVACWPVDKPCVTLQVSSLCLLTQPHEARALAQWLIACSIALEDAPKEELHDGD